MNLDNLDMFGYTSEEILPTSLSVIPVSVVDIAPQKKREQENHAALSSRASYSPFPSEIADLCYEFYLRDATTVVDPFAGWGERHAKADQWGKEYWGWDISEEAIRKAKEEFGVDNMLGDSMWVDPPAHNGLLTCPPYWNLEKYASPDGLDRNKTWEEFKLNLYRTFKTFYEVADEGSIYCIMVGDWRKDHKYYDLEFVVSEIFKDMGAEVVDKVVVSRKLISKIKIMLPQAKRLGYSVRVHENLLVFRKPQA